MKDYKKVILYILMFLYIIFSRFIFNDNYEINNLIVWLVFFIIAVLISKGSNKRYKSKKNLIKTILIIVLIYFILYFISGLFLTYQKSPYTRSLYGLIKNIFIYSLLIFFQEYIRNIYIKSSTKSKLEFVLITILFVSFNINFNSLGSYFISTESMFRFILNIVIYQIVENLLLCYLIKRVSYVGTCCYRIPLTLIPIVLPILPKIDWFIEFIIKTILCFIIYTCFHFIIEKMNGESRRITKKTSPISYIPFILILLLLLGFMLGWFKYYPLTIMSNSMNNSIMRGDMVIVKKIKNSDLEDITTGQVIAYNLNGSTIVHRVIKVEKINGEFVYTTKGDNNDLPDRKKVMSNQVLGVINFKVSYIGFPSVWINDFISKNNKPDVQT